MYYQKLGPWLLNQQCEIGSVDKLIEHADELFDEMGLDSRVFARPCSLEKVFTGQLVSREDFSWLLERARFSGCDILVAKPTNISCEWRLIVHGRSPITGSQYRLNSNTLQSSASKSHQPPGCHDG